MAQCAFCGAELPDGSRYCNSCGRQQRDPNVLSPSVDTTSTLSEPPHLSAQDGQDTPVARNWKSILTVLVIALLLAGIAGGAYVENQKAKRRAAERAAAMDSARAKGAAAIETARKNGSLALADVEKCQSAVHVGVTLQELQGLSSKADASALQFARTGDGALLPNFSFALEKAASLYEDSCAEWLADNNAATAKWQAAYDAWDPLSGEPAPKITAYKDDSKTQKSWDKASAALADARAKLETDALEAIKRNYSLYQ